jgi:hypothetical protein
VFNYLSAADIVLHAVKGIDAVAARERRNRLRQTLMKYLSPPTQMPVFKDAGRNLCIYLNVHILRIHSLSYVSRDNAVYIATA